MWRGQLGGQSRRGHFSLGVGLPPKMTPCFYTYTARVSYECCQGWCCSFLQYSVRWAGRSCQHSGDLAGWAGSSGLGHQDTRNRWISCGGRWAIAAASLPSFLSKPWSCHHLMSPFLVLTSASRLHTGSLNRGSPLGQQAWRRLIEKLPTGHGGRARVWRQVELGWDSLGPHLALLLWKPEEKVPRRAFVRTTWVSVHKRLAHRK